MPTRSRRNVLKRDLLPDNVKEQYDEDNDPNLTAMQLVNKIERDKLLKSLPKFPVNPKFPEQANLEELRDIRPINFKEDLSDNLIAIEGKIETIENPFQRLVNGMIILTSTPELNTTQVEIEDDDETIPAQLMLENSDSEYEPPGSDDDESDYPDSDDEIVRETELIEKVSIRDTVSKQSTNDKSSLNMEFISPNGHIQREVIRISRILTKWGLDYSEEEIHIYSLHLVQKLMNDVEFPDNVSDILYDILDSISVRALGYD